MNRTLLELYRHKTWATLRLIEHCQGLADEHLDATILGTFGTIRDTLQHLVAAEEGYFWGLTGERLAEPLPDEPVPLGVLADRIRRLGPRWELLAQDSEVPQPRGQPARWLAHDWCGAHGAGHPPRRRPPQSRPVDSRRARPGGARSDLWSYGESAAKCRSHRRPRATESVTTRVRRSASMHDTRGVPVASWHD